MRDPDKSLAPYITIFYIVSHDISKQKSIFVEHNKMEEGRRKREEGRGKKEEGRGKMEDGRGKMWLPHSYFIQAS